MIILGISALYHDSAAAIVDENGIIAAVQEERFTRKKHDNRMPYNAIDYCLKEAGVNFEDLDKVIYYDNPLLTMDRFINNLVHLGVEDAEYQLENVLPDVAGNRMRIHELLRQHYGYIGVEDTLYVLEHHVSHAASAFYPSPFEEAAIITTDGVGEWATTTIGIGSGSDLEILKEIDYPHSLGLIYSAFTAFCGFKVNEGDYKFMGLAPYGNPKYVNVIKNNLIDVKEDGSFRLNLDFFDFYRGQYMTNRKFDELFGGPKREPETEITRREMDIAASMQAVTEEIMVKLARTARKLTGKCNLVMAGGVALNCVANGKILKEKIFDNIFIQPAAGDAGGALGCALYLLYHSDITRKVNSNDSMRGSFLGCSYSSDYIGNFLDKNNYAYHKLEEDELISRTVDILIKEKVVGWFQGAMEFGPRALGHRSIIADPRSELMQSKLNLKIKYRESFRPFAPSVLEEKVTDYFEMDSESPYMLFVSDVCENRRLPFDREELLKSSGDNMLPVVNAKRSDIPAVTHVDYSARIQTVDWNRNSRYYELIKAFGDKTGCYVLVNTSFNVRGEPIVCTPEDAYRCFMRTEMDVLVLGDYLLYKEEQPKYEDKENWQETFELD